MAAGCRYDSAPAWDPRLCSGTFTPGARALGQHLVDAYGGSYQGYACRPNTADASRMSVHGTGRAIDFFPASKAIGDQVARWLVEHHEAFGVQLIVWWRNDWTCSAGWTSYGGPHPHEDHLHIELTIAAGATNTRATYESTGGLTVADIDQLIDVIKAQGKLTRKAVKRQGLLTRLQSARQARADQKDLDAILAELEALGLDEA